MASRVPRWAAVALGLLAWVVGVPFAHAGLPWAVSLLATRHGWRDGAPGIWNFVGLAPVALASAGLIWIMAHHLRRTPESVKLELTPQYLLLRGPYRFTRNPMYVAELALWLGWSVFFGSAPVALGFALLFVAMSWVVPREERALEARFGATYRDYLRRVPRWLGRLRRSPR